MIAINMQEWRTLTPDNELLLQGLYLEENAATRDLLAQLKERIHITEGRYGLSIETTSFVGRVQIGELNLTIRPKIKMTSLLNLMRYAYDLRDLVILETTTQALDTQLFQDMLINQLIAEVTEIMARGLRREYIPTAEALSSPRGRINIQKIAATGGIRASTLPCDHHPRLNDNLLNRILRAGLYLAARITDDLLLRTRARRLAALFEDSVATIALDSSVIAHGYRQINRLNNVYEASIILIKMLLDGQGISLEDGTSLPLPGFLFDMNHFWETLLSRFLNENLVGYTVRDQFRLHRMMTYAKTANPQNRRAPSPRPDYVVLQHNQLVAMLDAKYRDIWNKGLPRDMLYQLAMYALSQGFNGNSAILYPVIDEFAHPEVIEIHDPINQSNQATITLRPVNLYEVERLIYSQGHKEKVARQKFAEHLAFG